MKKVLVIGLALAMTVGLLAACTTEDPATYKDGTFTAISDSSATERIYTGFDGYVEVTLTIEDDVITEIVIDEYDQFGELKDYETYGVPGVWDGSDLEDSHVALAEAMLEAQSWDVDIVTGATGTSEKAIQAAKRALEKALVEPASDNEFFDGVFMGRTEPDGRGSWLIAWVIIENDQIVDVVFGETADTEHGFKDYDDYGNPTYDGNDLREAHEALAAAMVAVNSADVDIVSGSTGTSEKAIEAVQNALDAARR